MIRILIADDHAIVRTGLKQIFERVPDFEVVSEASNASEVMQRLRGDPPDLVLLDLDMPGTSGVDLILRIKAQNPAVPILVLSMHNESNFALHAIRAGASGYITKDCDLTVLLPGIRKVAEGGTYIAPGMAEKILFDGIPTAQNSGLGLLSAREVQVFNLLFSGMGVNEIAMKLGISNKTVSTYKVRLMEKLEISSMVDLVRFALQHQQTD